MAEVKTNSGGGMGLLGWLFIVFLILKLNPGGHLDTGVQDWSWWWVTAPVWGPIALFIVGGIIFGIGWLIAKAFETKRRRKARKALEARKALRQYGNSLKR